MNRKERSRVLVVLRRTASKIARYHEQRHVLRIRAEPKHRQKYMKEEGNVLIMSGNVKGSVIIHSKEAGEKEYGYSRMSNISVVVDN